MERNKKEREQEAMDTALEALLSVFGKETPGTDGAQPAADGMPALRQILRYLKADAPEPPEEVTELREKMEYMLRPAGVMCRRVRLTGAWWKEAAGPFLGSLADGTAVALLPAAGGYCYTDGAGKRVRITKKNAGSIEKEACSFYRGYPLRPLKLMDFLKFRLESISVWDVVWVLIASLGVSLLGLVLPMINKLIFDNIIPGNLREDILPVAALLVGATVGSLLFGISRTLVMSRLSNKMSFASQNAVMARIFSLPVSFFKDYSAGELAQRFNGINTVSQVVSDGVLTAGLSVLFSFVYLFQMNSLAPVLVGPGMLAIAVMLAVIVATVLLRMKFMKLQTEAAAKCSGLTFSLLGGIQKIKLAGAERRAFAKWAELFAREGRYEYNPPFGIKIGSALTGAVSLGGTILLYLIAGTNDVSQSDYIAFSTAYGAISAALIGLSGVVVQLATIKPLLDLVQPIYDAQPEKAEEKKQAVSLSGEVEVSHLSFRYGEKLPYVLKDLSLHVAPGEYVGIVGKSGCGKSTLMRLLIGFETPGSGAVYYDGEDLREFDLRSIRQKIGVALQNGKLFAGDIFSNIVVTAPWSTQEDAWEAARLAGIADDIAAMPMGMHTVISEGSGGISGGQKQRLLIARALVGKPKILLFDEATSALDNAVQNEVAKNIARLGCTRIAIAHRLSTVRECDRIIMIDGGQIAEEGTYDELMERKGLFYEFAVRQI